MEVYDSRTLTTRYYCDIESCLNFAPREKVRVTAKNEKKPDSTSTNHKLHLCVGHKFLLEQGNILYTRIETASWFYYFKPDPKEPNIDTVST